MENPNDSTGEFKDSSLIRVVMALEGDFKAGDDSILLTALFFCCHIKDSPIPRWVADEVKDRYLAWDDFKVKTLDEAFNVTRPKGFHLNAHRKRHEYEYKVYQLVSVLAQLGDAIDEDLFNIIGSAFGISGGTARDYYYSQKNEGKNFLK